MKDAVADKRPSSKKPVSRQTAWVMVAAGGLLEIVWASSFKYDIVPPILVLVAILVSFDLLVRAAQTLPIGTVYGVFAGIGTVGLVVFEAVWEGYISPVKAGLILLLLVFIIMLKITGDRKEDA